MEGVDVIKRSDRMEPNEVAGMVLRGMSHREISKELKSRFPHAVKGLSERSVRRFCQKHCLHKPCSADIDEIVRDSVLEVRQAYYNN